MKTRWSRRLNIVVQTKHRLPGKGTIDGKDQEWGEAYQVVCVAVEDEKFQARKYNILPERVSEIWPKLENLSWGCLVQLDFEGYYIRDMEVLDDWFSNFMDSMD